VEIDMLMASSFSCAGRNEVNQDSILIEQLDDEFILLAIADGMGGELGGQVASSLAISSLKATLLAKPSLLLHDAFESIQSDFIKMVELQPELEKMGTTLTVCVVNKNKVNVAHVGDTRLYHLRGNGILTRTTDQTELQRLLDDRILTKNRAKNYYRKNVLLSVMSANRKYEIQTTSFRVEQGDRLLLLTDGAYSLASKKEIRDISLNSNSIVDLMKGLKSVIESKEIKDDYSAVGYEARNV
jgi:serine/threonine protein phosphatase PrpC